MQFVTRLADPATTSSYPLACTQPAQWVQHDEHVWGIELVLPAIPAEHIIVPSFATLGADYRFQFILTHTTSEIALQPVPVKVPAQDAAAKTTGAPNTAVTDNAPSQAQASTKVAAHIDCWHTSADIDAAKLRLRVCSSQCPERYLIVLTARPLDHVTGEFKLPEHSMRIRQPKRISQMRGPKPIRQRICSPTALAMALADIDPPVDWAATIAACYDPLTRAYGSWPLALHWASQQGRLGAVETFSDWSEVGLILARGMPIVCSIRFAAGELTNAPLKQTSGHLVTLYGFDKNVAYVLDPAGKNIREVAHKYDLEEFSRAWLARRGAAYVFCSEP